MPNIVTFTFFQFEGRANKWQAFRQMGIIPALLKNIEGARFAKMLGCGGKNGFSIWPNWGMYSLMISWNDENSANTFFDKHPIFQQHLLPISGQYRTIWMRPCMVHGQWNGLIPFEVSATMDLSQPIAVLTRAAIKPRFLWHFWRFVPSVSRSVENKDGLRFTNGIGELPLIEQATFSIWNSGHQMMDYAYRSPHHKEVVQKTRELGWYSEELFARFVPYKHTGDWALFEV